MCISFKGHVPHPWRKIWPTSSASSKRGMWSCDALWWVSWENRMNHFSDTAGWDSVCAFCSPDKQVERFWWENIVDITRSRKFCFSRPKIKRTKRIARWLMLFCLLSSSSNRCESKDAVSPKAILRALKHTAEAVWSLCSRYQSWIFFFCKRYSQLSSAIHCFCCRASFLGGSMLPKERQRQQMTKN